MSSGGSGNFSDTVLADVDGILGWLTATVVESGEEVRWRIRRRDQDRPREEELKSSVRGR